MMHGVCMCVVGVEVIGGMQKEVQIIEEMCFSIQCHSHKLLSCALLKSAFRHCLY